MSVLTRPAVPLAERNRCCPPPRPLVRSRRLRPSPRSEAPAACAPKPMSQAQRQDLGRDLTQITSAEARHDYGRVRRSSGRALGEDQRPAPPLSRRITTASADESTSIVDAPRTAWRPSHLGQLTRMTAFVLAARRKPACQRKTRGIPRDRLRTSTISKTRCHLRLCALQEFRRAGPLPMNSAF